MSSPAQSPLPPIPAPRRPAGLILAAIVLALITCWGLLTAFSMTFVAIFIRTPQTDQYPAVKGIQIGMGLIVLLICSLSAWTVVGLFRLKRWARFGILIFGGLLTVFSGLFVILFTSMSFISLPASANTSGVPPAIVKFMYLFTGGVFLCLALIGIWWLIYFNLRRIRTLFASSGPSVPLSPLSGDPLLQTESFPAPMMSGPSVIEVLLNCLAVLYFIGAASVAVMTLLRFPLFLLGFTFRGVSASIFACVLTALNIGIGIGILRRTKLAWIAALGTQALAVISWLPFFIPSYQPLVAAYQQEILQHMASRRLIPPSASNETA